MAKWLEDEELELAAKLLDDEELELAAKLLDDEELELAAKLEDFAGAAALVANCRILSFRDSSSSSKVF